MSLSHCTLYGLFLAAFYFQYKNFVLVSDCAMQNGSMMPVLYITVLRHVEKAYLKLHLNV